MNQMFQPQEPSNTNSMYDEQSFEERYPYEGYTPQEARIKYGQELTDFELMELDNFECIHTIGKVRRAN